MKEKKYSISEASRLLEVENHVLRYWEEELELKIPRNELGHRFYRDEEIQLLYCIKELKNKGFQLKAVKEVLPDLEEKKMIDVHKLIVAQVELENMGAAEEDEQRGKLRRRNPKGKKSDQAQERPAAKQEKPAPKAEKVTPKAEKPAAKTGKPTQKQEKSAPKADKPVQKPADAASETAAAPKPKNNNHHRYYRKRRKPNGGNKPEA